MSFYAQYASPAQVNIAAEGANGGPIPTESLLVAGENPSGNLEPLQTDASGALITTPATGSVQHVIVDSSALPTGAATQTTLSTVSTTLGSILLDLTNGTQITQITGTVPLPSGASTSANQATEIASLAAIQTSSASTATNTANIPTVGQKTSAGSLPVVIASDQSPIPVTTTITGVSTAANQTNGSQKSQIVDGSGNVISSTANALNVQVENFPSTQPISGSVTVSNFPATQPVSAVALPLPTGASTAALQSNVQSAPGTPQTVAVTIQGNASSVAIPISAAALPLPSGASTSANQATEIASLASIVANTNESTAAAVTSVASSATSVQLLASNSSRKMATFYNSSTAILFLKLGTTASSTSYTLQMAPGSYYELPARQYSGEIDGIWASANGSVLITELS